MRYLYSFLFYLLIPFVLLRLLWRSRKLKQYRQRILERFAIFKIQSRYRHGIWLHSVSVGETLAAVPLIKQLKKTFPDLPIVVTTMTPTGSERVTAALGDSVFHVYVPYDLPDVVQRFLHKVQPHLIIIMETEIWPNLLYYSRKSRIPILLANARLSEKSAKGYARFRKLTKRVLNRFDLIAAQAAPDAERFIQLGLSKEKVKVVGSIKFDINMPPSIFETGELIRHQLGADRFIWIAASTHEGEENHVLEAFKEVKKRLPKALLLLVPRHPERFDKVFHLCVNVGFTVARRSKGDVCNASIDIFLGDTMGELMQFYAASDVAFVGGSLVPIGGHNLLEPAVFRLAILSGPHTFNFTVIRELFEKEEAVVIVEDAKQLAEQVILLLSDERLRRQLGANALKVVQMNKGMVGKYVQLAKELLDKRATR
ncbi:MAG: lipid IV(A) 3-deoxy-D-manno-octulosonic acid transferase [Pseudomonadota bacterium]